MAGGLGTTYGQTDEMHDRSYLIRQLASHSRGQREQARVALADLNRQEAQQRQDYALSQRDAALQQHQIEHEATQRRIIAHQNAMEMDKQLKMDRDTEIDEQGHGLLLSMMQLDARKRRGEISKDQYDQGILDAATQFPLGLRHPEAKKHLEFVTTEADRQNQFIARRKIIEDAKSANRLTGPVPEKIAARHSHVLGMLDMRNFQQQGDMKRQEQENSKKQETANITAGKANVPYSPVPYNPTYDADTTRINAELKGYQTEKAQLEQAYPQLTGQVQQAQAPVNTPTPAPSPTPEPSPTPDTRPVPGFNIPILANTAPAATPDQTPIYTPSPSPEATATQAPVHLGRYNPETGEFE